MGKHMQDLEFGQAAMGACDFNIDCETDLWFYGRTANRWLAVWSGRLREQKHRRGLVVVRGWTNAGDEVRVDRVPLSSTLQTDDGGYAMWLGRHLESGHGLSLVVDIGSIVLDGAEVQPLDLPPAITDRGFTQAVCHRGLNHPSTAPYQPSAYPVLAHASVQ